MAENRQRLVLNDRQELEISGVRNVDSFDEQMIELDGVLGGLAVAGRELKIAALDLQAGQVVIRGQIDALSYVKSREERSVRHKSRNVMARLLR